MAILDQLKNVIDANINTNGIQSITGGKLNYVLRHMVDIIGAFLSKKQDALVDGENIKTINGQSILGEGDITIKGNGTSVIVDTEFNQDSNNPIANSAVTAALKEIDETKQSHIEDLDTIREGAKKGATAIQNVKTINGQSIKGEGNIEIKGGNEIDVEVDTELSEESSNAIANKTVTAALKNKVEKVDGKQLSTEDFTSVLKAKLDGLSNYDDSSIKNAINSLTTQINTLVSGDASVAIESFNEIIAFLNGIEDSESLDSIIAAIEQQIAGRATTAMLEEEIANVERQITGVSTTIPKKTSQLNNDSGFTTEEYVNTQVRTAIISALNTEV